MTPFEWLSSSMAIASVAACWRRDVRWVAFFMLSYSVLYFLPITGLLFSGFGEKEILFLHLRGSSGIAKVQGGLAIGFAGFALWVYAGAAIIRPWYGTVAIACGLLATGMLLMGEVADILKLLNVLSLGLMIGYVSLGADAWEYFSKAARGGRIGLPIALLLLALLTVSVGLAWWEIAADKAWARFTASNGYEIQRASSMMFNPNLYAMWCSVIAIVFAFIWQARLLSGKDNWLLAGVALSGLGIFFSSSRSHAYLLLIFLASTAVLLPREERRRWGGLLAYLLALLLAVVVSMAAWRLDGYDEVAGRFVALAVRLVDAPWHLAAIFLNSIFLDSQFFTIHAVPTEVLVAFEGRFQGEGRDSGWLTAYDDAGLLGGLVLAGYLGGLAILALRGFLFQRGIHTVYALGIVGYGIALGVFMRYQVFPVWIFLSVMLAPCLALWRSVLPKATPGLRVWL